MAEPLEHAYFNWLYAKVCDPRAKTPSRKFEQLLGILHRLEFVWILSGDDNRAEDGVDLRFAYLTDARLEMPRDDPWLLEGCSVLEMLIALSIKAAFESDETTQFWFWRMLENIHISELNDGSSFDPELVHQIIETVVFRMYDFNGGEGLFPLMRSRSDQRRVELWYQLSSYMYENDFG